MRIKLYSLFWIAFFCQLISGGLFLKFGNIIFLIFEIAFFLYWSVILLLIAFSYGEKK